MPNFMIAYYGGNPPTSKEEGELLMERWKGWVESLGDRVVNPGTPLIESKVVTSGGVYDEEGSGGMKGFAVIKAENMDEAAKFAESDPFLTTGGTIRLSEMMEMG